MNGNVVFFRFNFLYFMYCRYNNGRKRLKMGKGFSNVVFGKENIHLVHTKEVTLIMIYVDTPNSNLYKLP